MMSVTTTRRIPERVVPGRPLGRHVRHDPRSLAYAVEPTGVVVSKTWKRDTAVLDQGNLGSCTGNAACGVIGSDPFHDVVAQLVPSFRFDEDAAIALYSYATTVDSFQGSYPPEDTGSDGLSVAKAAKARGLISGYQHILSAAAAQTAIASGPFITGVNWYSSMDDPDSRGLVTVGGEVRGGHEFEVIGYDATSDVWEFVNSWGTSWGTAGHFFMATADYARLLSEQGDATTFVPLTAPAPTPTPTAPTYTRQFSADDFAELENFGASSSRIYKNIRAAWRRGV